MFDYLDRVEATSKLNEKVAILIKILQTIRSCASRFLSDLGIRVRDTGKSNETNNLARSPSRDPRDDGA